MPRYFVQFTADVSLPKTERPESGARKRDEERAAASDVALHPDLAAMRIDDALRDVEPKTEPLPIGDVHAVETLEDARELLLGNPASRVAHGDAASVVQRRQLDHDGAARLRELDGVTQQVREHLPIDALGGW